MQGFLEFNKDAVTLAYIQYQGSWFGSKENNIFNTFKTDQITKFMTMKAKERMKVKQEEDLKTSGMNMDEAMKVSQLNEMIKNELKKVREVFSKSAAGYCVGSYVLGLRDRHADNIMINYVEGNFLHIDFGHFLDNGKIKFGLERERDPFVFTPEIAEFINGGPFKKSFYQNVFLKRKRAMNKNRQQTFMNRNGTQHNPTDNSYGSPGKRSLARRTVHMESQKTIIGNQFEELS